MSKHQSDSKATLDSTRALIASQINRENKRKIEAHRAHRDWLKSIEDNEKQEMDVIVGAKRTKEAQETLICELPEAAQKVLLELGRGFVFHPTDTINTLVRGCSPLLAILMTLYSVEEKAKKEVVQILLQYKDIRADHMVPYNYMEPGSIESIGVPETGFGGLCALDIACIGDFKEIIPRLIELYPDALHRILRGGPLRHINGVPGIPNTGKPHVGVSASILGTSIFCRHVRSALKLEIAKILLDMGADINQRAESGNCFDSEGRTVILGAPGQEGQTPLFYAALNEFFEGVKYLLERGAKIDLKNVLARTALQMVEESPPSNERWFGPLYMHERDPRKRECVIKILRAAENLFVVCQERTRKGIDEAERCLKIGASVNQCNQFGATPLHLACIANAINMVSFLVSQNASIITPDDSGVTPLNLCTLEACEVMLKFNHDFTKMNKLGKTAIDCIAERTHKVSQEIRNRVMNYIQPEIDKMIFKVRQLFGGKVFNDIRLVEKTFRDELGYKPFARTEPGKMLVRQAMYKAMRSMQIQRACLRIERDIAQERMFAEQWETWQKRYHSERPLAAANGCGPGALARYR